MIPYKLSEILALIIGLACFRASRELYIKAIILLLLLTVINEVIFIPYIKSHHLFNRNIAYNIFSIIDMATWFYVFYEILQQAKVRKWIIAAAIGAFAWTAIELFNKGWHNIHPDSFRFYEVCLILFSLYYFYLILKKEYHPVFGDPNFWLCSACIFYHSTLFLTFTTLAENNYWELKNAMEVFTTLHSITNVVYYLMLCGAFIACYFNYRQQKYSQG